jgi:branched-chain amino acid transport system permease protein
VFVWSLMRSPWGRFLKSIREDEDAARSLGKNVFSYKLQSLMVGGVIGALGGTVIAVGNQVAQPGNYSTTLTFFAYTILILGGVARVKGPIIGAMIFWFVITFVDNVLAEAVANDAVPGWLPNFLEVDGTNFGQVKFIISGFALAVLVVFRPQGIFGDRREQVFDVR